MLCVKTGWTNRHYLETFCWHYRIKELNTVIKRIINVFGSTCRNVPLALELLGHQGHNVNGLAQGKKHIIQHIKWPMLSCAGKFLGCHSRPANQPSSLQNSVSESQWPATVWMLVIVTVMIITLCTVGLKIKCFMFIFLNGYNSVLHLFTCLNIR